MAQFEKKIQKEYFELVVSGKKKYELRLGDFIVNEGDTLLLKEWDVATQTYTGRTIEKRVNYVKKFSLSDFYQFWTKEEIEKHGIQVLQLD